MALPRNPSVCALIPHWACEAWLPKALASLVGQGRPLDGIVVIDDGSACPPEQIVSCFKDVTLLACSENVGPYRLVQRVIETTDFDAYLFQDADDWSCHDRLSSLVAEARRTGAGLVGCFEQRFFPGGPVVRVTYPKDVNAALSRRPGDNVLLHPSSLLARELFDAAGGFATGLRFGADSEFVRRAHYAGRIVNAPVFSYCRRKRTDALTMSGTTGVKSPARRELIRRLWRIAHDNAAAVRNGDPPDLIPFVVAPPVELVHLTGPRLF